MGLSMTQTIAALYVDPNGVYANLPGVEVWDEGRSLARCTRLEHGAVC
jgi:hypothetical protein